MFWWYFLILFVLCSVYKPIDSALRDKLERGEKMKEYIKHMHRFSIDGYGLMAERTAKCFLQRLAQ